MTSAIKRVNPGELWSEVVCYNGLAWWVEVAEDPTADFCGQFSQILNQIDATCGALHSDRASLLKVEIYLADLADGPELNRLWKDWLPAGAAPVRACVGATLSPGYRVEVLITAAVKGE